jgi:hypothetical protein
MHLDVESLLPEQGYKMHNVSGAVHYEDMESTRSSMIRHNLVYENSITK